jgi:hypothetical protein
MDSFAWTCNQIFGRHPEAIGVAYKGLDCGCSLVCGVSAQGEPVGELHHVSNLDENPKGQGPICLLCKKDNGLKRVVREGILWPGTEAEWPDQELRLEIGSKVFGPDYHE